MKIAVASDKGMVTEHFGHCESFIVFNVEDGRIVKEETLASPGHKPGFLPNFLADKGVNIIISGGMGGGAVDIFNERGVEVVIGAGGEARAAAEAYLAGELEPGGAACESHNHEDCGA